MELAVTYRKLRLKSGKSNYRISSLSGLDQSFLGRIETGTRGATRDTVLRIGFALIHDCNVVSLHDVDGLLLDAGFAPLQRDR